MATFHQSSRTTLRDWTLCSAVMSILILLPWWLGEMPLRQVTGSLSVAFRVTALLTMVGAMRRGEHVGKGPLNGWDQSIAFSGLATIGHMLQSITF